MTVPLLIISIRTESNVTEVLSPVLIFLVGAERQQREPLDGGGVYNVGRYMPRWTGSEG